MRGRAAQQVLGRHRPSLDGHEVENARPLRILLPCKPRRKKIQAEAETCFEDHPLPAAGPGTGQPASAQENVARLLEAARAGAIDVVEAAAAWRAIRQPLDRLSQAAPAFECSLWGRRHVALRDVRA